MPVSWHDSDNRSGSYTGEDPQCRKALLYVRRTHSNPAVGTLVVHLGAATKPKMLAPAQLLAEFIRLIDEAQKEREILTLIVRRIVHIHRPSLEQDRAQQTGPGQPTTSSGDLNGDPLGPVQSLPATGYLNGVEWWNGQWARSEFGPR